MQLPVTLVNDGVLIGRHTVISFLRTLRVPENGKHYSLPSGFGRLPVLRVEDVADRVPVKWREEGGLIIPLYQCEALFLELSGANWCPTIAKVAVGRVNAITGKPHDLELKKGRQDYVVIPVQRWLDGINAGKEIVRQFVATPLGQGFTVEAQVTDEETHGGFQIAVFDPKDGKFSESIASLQRRPFRMPPGSLRAEGRLNSQPTGQFNSQSPYEKEREIFEMGIAAGGSIRQQIFEDEYGIDTWDPEVLGSLNVHIVNSEIYKEITGRTAPPSPITANDYAKRQIPWYKHYDESRRSVSVPSIFKKILTLGQIDKGRGAVAKSDVSFENAPVTSVKTPTLAERVNELRRSALQNYSENCYSKCLTQSRMCGELIDYHLDELTAANLSTSAEQMASQCFCIASECALRLEKLILAEDLANRSLLISFSEDALSVRLQVRMRGGKLEKAREDCEELIRRNPLHKTAVKISNFLFDALNACIPESEMARVPSGQVAFGLYKWSPENIPQFFLSIHPVTWQTWKVVRDWAKWNEYDIGNVGIGSLENHPVHSVSWYDAMKWCNAKSQMENLTPVYSENGACYKSGCLVPDFDEMANGYRLPTDAEWIWAAQGADQSCNDDSIEINTIDNVTWHKGNSSAAAVNMDNGRGTWPVGRKQPNCLGIFDMRGNVCEWCASKPAGKMSRSCSSTRGGSWNDQAESSAMPVLCIRYPQERSNEIGFRIARSL